MIRHTVTHQGHAYEILELRRADWGATIDAGRPLDPATISRWALHHTVGALHDWDGDGIRHGDLDDIIRFMRDLETNHTALAPPGVPYSWLPFKGTHDRQAILAEGRGSYRTGAHTACNNSTTLAWSLPGNYEHETVSPAQVVAMRWIAARDTPHVTLAPLGHQQFPHCPMPGGGNYHATACPGRNALPVLAQLAPPYRPPTPEDLDMTADELRTILDEELAPIRRDVATLKTHLLNPGATASKPPENTVQKRVGQIADKLQIG